MSIINIPVVSPMILHDRIDTERTKPNELMHSLVKAREMKKTLEKYQGETMAKMDAAIVALEKAI